MTRAFLAGQAADVTAQLRLIAAPAARGEASQIHDQLDALTAGTQLLRQEVRHKLRQSVHEEVRSALDQVGASRA
jgi:hypothetical protein